MWLSKGHSPGKKVQAISNDFACQYSDSFCLIVGSYVGSSFICKINLISVE